jgi:hypothetical protein
MKRHGNLYSLATSEEALYHGYLAARKGKRARHACHEFDRALGSNIAELAQQLASGTYEPLPYNTFTVLEPKPRSISAPAFRDRVVQHAVYSVIQPILDRTFIDQSFACRPGFGTHAAADYVQRSLAASAPDSYTVHLDVRKFYYSAAAAQDQRRAAAGADDALCPDAAARGPAHRQPVVAAVRAGLPEPGGPLHQARIEGAALRPLCGRSAADGPAARSGV